MNERQTQEEMVLAALQDGQKLTALEALQRFGCFRLAARIYRLRKAGHNVVKDIVERNGKHIAIYRLEEP